MQTTPTTCLVFHPRVHKSGMTTMTVTKIYKDIKQEIMDRTIFCELLNRARLVLENVRFNVGKKQSSCYHLKKITVVLSLRPTHQHLQNIL